MSTSLAKKYFIIERIYNEQEQIKQRHQIEFRNIKNTIELLRDVYD